MFRIEFQESSLRNQVEAVDNIVERLLWTRTYKYRVLYERKGQWLEVTLGQLDSIMRLYDNIRVAIEVLIPEKGSARFIRRNSKYLGNLGFSLVVDEQEVPVESLHRSCV